MPVLTDQTVYKKVLRAKDGTRDPSATPFVAVPMLPDGSYGTPTD